MNKKTNLGPVVKDIQGHKLRHMPGKPGLGIYKGKNLIYHAKSGLQEAELYMEMVMMDKAKIYIGNKNKTFKKKFGDYAQIQNRP